MTLAFELTQRVVQQLMKKLNESEEGQALLSRHETMRKVPARSSPLGEDRAAR